MTTLAFLHAPGTPEIIVIFLAALLIFGPKSLPKLGRAMGQAIREFKEASNRITESINSLDEEEGSPREVSRRAAAKPAITAARAPSSIPGEEKKPAQTVPSNPE